MTARLALVLLLATSPALAPGPGGEAGGGGRPRGGAPAGQDARLAYYEWVRARLQVLIADRQLTQVKATLGQVQAFADVHRLSRADLLRVESQEAQAEQT